MTGKEEVDKLVLKRGQIKATVTRVRTYFTQKFKPTDNIYQLKSRLQNLQSAFKEFNDVQNQIEFLDSTENRMKEREEFEDDYYDLESKILVAIETRENANNAPGPSNRIQNSNQNSDSSRPSNVKLPTLDLPSFSGNYLEWTSFADTFKSLIHQSNLYTEIEKFHYLKSCLKGDAHKTIEGVLVSAANYKTVWAMLEKRFENKRLIIQEHVLTIINSPSLVKNSHKSLRKLLDDVTINIDALTTLEQPTDKWDALIVPIITSKFDFFTRKEWESTLNSEIPQYKELIEFLEKKATLLESLNACDQTTKSQSANQSKPKSTSRNNQNGKSTAACHASINKPKCSLCKRDHYLYACPDFLNLTVPERNKEVQRLKLCTNCLRNNHLVDKCTMRNCRHCNEKHNSLLHHDSPNENDTSSNPVALHSSGTSLSSSHVLLATAQIIVNNGQRDSTVRALLDNGSQSNFITKELCERLRLITKPINWKLTGITGMQSECKEIVKIKFRSCYNKTQRIVTCLVVPRITDRLPSVSINRSHVHIPPAIKLADPNFHKAASIDILLGAEIFWEVLRLNQIRPSENPSIMFQETDLGYLITGKTQGHKFQNSVVCNLSLNSLSKQISKFWEVEEFPKDDNKTIRLTQEEIYCENHFTNTYSRNSEGRFIVRLPFRTQNSMVKNIGETKQLAIKQFLYMERKFDKNPELKRDYTHFIKEYSDLQHMELVNQPDPYQNERVFLPHHSVIRESSSTTRLRVVFNPSLKSSNGVTLNDLLIPGPKLQEDLFDIIIRFRTHQFVFTADINKMFRQILVAEDDRKYQTIIWRDSQEQQLQLYQLITVTYGFNCAPYLAVKCLHQLSEDAAENFPIAADVIKRDFYMDDVLTGANTIDETLKIQNELIEILKGGCFELRKFASNDETLLPASSINQKDTHIVSFDRDGVTKTLGLFWNCLEDTLNYRVNVSQIATASPKDTLTKRKILSEIARIYDPLNLIGPVIILAKLIMQELWKRKTAWDERVPDDLLSIWYKITKNLNIFNNIQIPRKTIPKFPFKTVELHGFADASQNAYGCCIYIRSRASDGNFETHLLCAKSRIAPLKTLTIPRLELMASVLLAKLMSKLSRILNVKFDNFNYWTDSTIVLAWLDSIPSMLNTFVANRVAEIQTLTNVENWRHVSSEDNPADIISRGAYPNELKNNRLWFHGPIWLSYERELWPERPKTEISNVPEKRNTTLTFISRDQLDFEFIVKFSNFNKLCRTIATCYRFFNNTRNKIRDNSSLSAQEINKATVTIIKVIQGLELADELKSLRSNENVKQTSKLKALNPFLDSDGLIRVGGRLQNADVNYSQRYPILLPKHYVTQLIIKMYHERQLHAGPTATLAAVRQRYWPVDGRNQVRKVTRGCISCFRAKPRSLEPIMGHLPKHRLTVTRPFTNCGIDYAGPLNLREGSPRSKRTSKAYIAVFICFSTKAVHLELVCNLTSVSFLNALKRFVSRRGMPATMYSDNATNFVGAQIELKKFLKSTEFKNSVPKHLANLNINWKFIPARAAHMGGIWEAAVKSAKSHLKRVVGQTLLTYEEMYTLLTGVEACLNSRPLCPLTSDPEELSALTPGHFLIGSPVTAVPEQDVTEIPKNRLTRWQHVSQMKQHFWNRWSREYLNELQKRIKWQRNQQSTIQVGTLVLLKDSSPPLTWKLGRVTTLHPGDDGVVRVVSVKTANGMTKRATRNLCPLPTE